MLVCLVSLVMLFAAMGTADDVSEAEWFRPLDSDPGAALVVNTLQQRDVNAILAPGSDKNGILDVAFSAIAENNPDAMLGYSTEFYKAYNQKRKAAKSR